MSIIYALRDPRDGATRYIGKCSSLPHRFRAHLNDKGSTRKARWIRSLLAIGLSPEAVELEMVEGDWQAAERRWISHFRAEGADLCNHTDGGEGLVGASRETRQKLAVVRRAIHAADPERAKEIARDPVRCAKISAALSGKRKSPEHVAKLPQNRPGYKRRTVRPKTPKAPKPHVPKDEVNRKRSAALKGRPKSEEWKEKARSAALKRWARVREGAHPK